MLGLAFEISAAVAIGTGVLDLVSTAGGTWESTRYSDSYKLKRSNNGHGRHLISTGIATVLSFLILIGVNFLTIYLSTPTFAGVGWLPLLSLNVVVVCIVFGVTNGITGRWALAAPGIGVTYILFCIIGLGLVNEAPLGSDSNTFSNIAQVTTDNDTANYPPTDDNHMVIVSNQNALNKANQAMGQTIPGSNVSIGSRYGLGKCVLQSVANHMYYVCGLVLQGTANNRAEKYIIPGYIVVDAEDPNAPPQAKLTYKMAYTPGAPFSHSITRLIWNSYSGYYIDDLTLEVNDQWQPFYTASIDRPIVRWQQSAPVGFITVDPQSGAIQRYSLKDIPLWVDRVYSATMAKNILNWWGEWKVVPWSTQGSGGRYMVDGDVNLVYTKSGPAWQALMTSKNNDTSINFIAMMDTRNTTVHMYRAPQGLTTQDTATAAIHGSKNNLRGLQPAGLALHEIYGQLIWVAPLVPSGTTVNQAESFAGLALLRATDSNSANVIIGTDKGDALAQLSMQLANGSNNSAPGATSNVKTVKGIISRINLISAAQPYVVFTLDGDTGHIYQEQVNTGAFDKLETTLTRIGENVTLTYVDDGSAVRAVSSFTNTAFNPSN